MPWHTSPSAMGQGQLELQAHLPYGAIGEPPPLRPLVGTQEVLGLAQGGGRMVISQGFLEGVAIMLRTR